LRTQVCGPQIFGKSRARINGDFPTTAPSRPLRRKNVSDTAAAKAVAYD
jgi:hypothetical protein